VYSSRSRNEGFGSRWGFRRVYAGESYLDETDVGALLAEALTADVEAVLADQTSGVGADAAANMY
jgi:hypothetical protein